MADYGDAQKTLRPLLHGMRGLPLIMVCLLAADPEASQATWKVQLEQPQIPSPHIILVR